MTIELGTTDVNKVMVGSSQVNRVYLGGSLVFGTEKLISGGSGALTVGAYSVGVASPGGGEVQFSMAADGATYGDNTGWYSPPTSGIGSGKWVKFTQTGGTLSCTGAALSGRVQLNATVTITGSYFGSANRFADFTIEVYDASSGGTLLDSGTLNLSVDGLS